MIGTILFIAVALIAVLAAIGMLTSNNAVHAALYLVVNFAAIALLYLGLNAPFLAMLQITVYAGAIMVLFLFVIMLLGAEQVPLESRLRWQLPLAAILTATLIGLAAFMLFSPVVGIDLPVLSPADVEGYEPEGPLAAQGAEPAEEGDQDLVYGNPKSVGAALFSAYLLPFELTGVLLLAAMVGAIVLAREERRSLKKSPHVQEVAGRDPRVLSGD